MCFWEKNTGCDRSVKSFGREKNTFFFYCVFILCALFGHSPAQENEPPAKLRLIHANEMAGVVERGQKLRKLTGNVKFRHGKTTITCRQSIEYPLQGRWVLIGDVNIFDDEKTLKADRVTYFAKSKSYEALKNVELTTDSTVINTRKLKYFLKERKAIAEGEVKIVNTLERTQLTSEYAEYFRDDKYTRLTQNPVFIQFDSTGREETRILGKVIESIDGGAQIKVDQDVKIFHRDVRAQCGHAEYFKNDEKIILTTEPVVFQKNNKLEGQTIELHLVNRKIKEVHVIERALATLLPDSAQKNEKPSTISGQKLVAFINNDVVDKVSVDGTATCVYHLYEKGVYKGMNRAQGDSLTLFLFGNTIQRIIFNSKPGKSTGKFLPPGFDVAAGEADANRKQAKTQAGNGKGANN
jgi:lipopolysaccharide export system protein LptA